MDKVRPAYIPVRTLPIFLPLVITIAFLPVLHLRFCLLLVVDIFHLAVAETLGRLFILLGLLFFLGGFFCLPRLSSEQRKRFGKLAVQIPSHLRARRWCLDWVNSAVNQALLKSDLLLSDHIHVVPAFIPRPA